MNETLSVNEFDDPKTDFDSPEYAFQIPGEGVRTYLANRAIKGYEASVEGGAEG